MTSSASFDPPAPEDLSLLIPGFTVGHLLTAGPHSAVYSAIQDSLERQIALRVYSPEASSDPDRVRAVEATTRAMARLKHPNLVGLYDSGERGGMIYVVMEFVAGKSLDRSLGGHSIDHAQAKAILLGICQGLAYAHQNGVVHGNLSANDILLTPNVEPKIGNLRGGDFEQGRAADLIATGGLLYRMLTGVEPSPHCVEPSALVGCPKEFDEVWRRCTQRDAGDAFASMQEIAEELAKLGKVMRQQPPATGPQISQSAKSVVAAGGRMSPPPATTTMAVSRPPGSQHHASHWVLIRNIVLIVVLVVAIVKVWDMTQRKQLDTQRKQEELRRKTALEQENRRQEARRKRLENAANRPQVPQGGGAKPQQPARPTQKIKEAALEDLRVALAAGKRDVMPVGSVRRADSAYLLVRRSMTWPEAHWFAEQHGAMLAVPHESADLMWLKSIAHGEPFWLGAGKSGRTTWLLLNGEDWHPSKEPAGLGRYLGADKFGFLRAAGGQVRLPVILQWKMDGSQPGKLETLLQSAAQSIAKGDPVYPPGSHFTGGQAYLLVARNVDWQEAGRLARLAGGNLAVVSDPGEAVHIADLAQASAPDSRYWLGGHRGENDWAWVTGESWRNAQIDGATDKQGYALAIATSTRWQAVNATAELSGFIIEWGGPGGTSAGQGSSAPASSGSAPPDALAGIEAQAVRLVQAALATRNKDLKSNASKMNSDLATALRNMPHSLQREWQPAFDSLQKLVETSRVPTEAATSRIKMNDEMRKISTYAATKQLAIEAEFTAAANQVRLAYQKKLHDMMAKALEQDNRKQIMEWKPRLDASESLDSWLAALGIAPGDG